MSLEVSSERKVLFNLPQLQYWIKIDPESYEEDFQRQYCVYEVQKGIFEQNPTAFNAQLHTLVTFLAQVAHCYPEQLKSFPYDLITLLERHGSTINPQMRLGFVRALRMLRSKNLLAPTALLATFFQLLRCQDKVLREFLRHHIVTDIKNINGKSKNIKLNKELQNFMSEMLKDNHAVTSKTALDVLIDLYNKRIWNDEKTVNIISAGCFSKITKVMVASMKFFVGRDDDDEEEEYSDEELQERNELRAKVLKKRRDNLISALHAVKVSRKTNKNKKRLKKIKANFKKIAVKKNTSLPCDFSAVHLVRDPQEVANRLLKRLSKMSERFEVKLLTINLISRLIGAHQLYLPNFYPLVQRYLFPHQRDVTKIMAYVAQAAHPLVPPDDLEPVVKTLAFNFVTERCSNEVMAVGLNAIRALCARNPYCMTEELLQDLTGYKKLKDKGVSAAARSLITLFQGMNPELLRRQDRGPPTELSIENRHGKYCQFAAVSFIPGAEILHFVESSSHKAKNHENNEDDSGEWVGNLQSDDSDQASSPVPEKRKKNRKKGSTVSLQDLDKRRNEGDFSERRCGFLALDGNESSGGENEDNSSQVPLEKGCCKTTLTEKEAVKYIMTMTPDERAEAATDIVTSRFLTDDDFAMIRAAQAAKKVQRFSASKKWSKRKAEKVQLSDDSEDDDREFVSIKSIEMIYKKRKHDKEARLLSMKAGHDEREKYGGPKGRVNPFASTTNKEKAKCKTFMMLKHKIHKKHKKSFREKQIKLREALLKHKRTIIK